ncbi:hypothetical protein V2A60_009606 [Cordyceps javanica]
MTGNKYRVSVAAFARDYISNNASLEESYGYAMYHWGIFVEPKGGKGDGRLYHVEEHPAMNSAQGTIPAGWRFEPRKSSAKASQRLIGRLLIGKLPAGNGFPEIDALLDQVPRPVMDTSENCISWTVNAITLLQKQGPPSWADDFNVEEFMEHAYSRIKHWYEKDDWKFKGHRESYVGRSF